MVVINTVRMLLSEGGLWCLGRRGGVGVGMFASVLFMCLLVRCRVASVCDACATGLGLLCVCAH